MCRRRSWRGDGCAGLGVAGQRRRVERRCQVERRQPSRKPLGKLWGRSRSDCARQFSFPFSLGEGAWISDGENHGDEDTWIPGGENHGGDYIDCRWSQAGFKIMLSCAQHWEDLSCWSEAIECLRLNVSQQVCAFISSRDKSGTSILLYEKWWKKEKPE
jgi:hypothetical protein